MAENQIFDDGPLSVVCTDPAAPASGAPVRYGSFTGLALTDERADGTTTVDFRENVWDLSVKAIDGGGNSAVVVGDAIYYVDADTPKLSKKNTGYLFGFAMETIVAGQTATIRIKKVSPGFSTPADATLNGAKLATVGDKGVVGGIPVIHRIDLAAGALADTDVVLTYKTRVIDAYLVLRGAGVASTVITVKNGATAITDAMAASGADKALVRAASLDDAQWEIAAGGTLRVTSSAGATQPACTVFVAGIRVP
jgi:hypothetical protein